MPVSGLGGQGGRRVGRAALAEMGRGAKVGRERTSSLLSRFLGEGCSGSVRPLEQIS